VVDTLKVREALGLCVKVFTPVAVIQDDGLTLGVRADDTLFDTV
jgi:hypothetical protein